MESLTNLVRQGWEVRQAHFPPVLHIAHPVATTSVSVTGQHCELDCAHCGGHYLKHMADLTAVVEDPGFSAKSCLISGGCNSEGKVPVSEHLEALKKLRDGRRMNLHVGLVSAEEIKALADIADAVSFDFVGDDETIREVFGTERSVEDYVRCYQELRRYCRVIPHICIGLYGGEIRGEYKAMELLHRMGAEALTFIVFIPTKGSRYGDRKPPALEAVVELLAEARQKFPDTPIHLGCMRPGGSYRNELDQWAVRLGVNTIVNPTPQAVRLATELGLTTIRGEECCVL